MKGFLLTLLLVVILAATTFGLDLGLAPGLSIKNAFIYLIFVIYLIETAVFRNIQLELPSILVLFAVFIGYCILSWAIAAFLIQPTYYEPIDTMISLKNQRVDHLIVFLLFFFGAQSKAEALRLIRVILWMLIFGNIITVMDGFNIPDLGIIHQREDGRLGGPMGESNQYGALLAFSLPGIIALVVDKGTNRLVAVGASFFSILAFLVASSRGATVGLLAGGAFFAVFLKAVVSTRKIVIGAILSIVAITAMITLFFNTELFDSLVTRFFENTSGDARNISSGRSHIWTLAFERMLDHPLSFVTGFGWDSYDHMRGFTRNTHNVYLNILFNLGLPALLIYLALLGNILMTCRRAIWVSEGDVRLYLQAFVLGFAALSVAVFFVDLYAPWIFIWAYTGLIIRLAVESAKSAERDVSENEEPGILSF